MKELKAESENGVIRMSSVLRNRLYKATEWDEINVPSEIIDRIWIVLFCALPNPMRVASILRDS